MSAKPRRSAPLRLGFPVKVLGEPGHKSNDTRRWQKNPHLRTSIEYLHAIFDYLHRSEITMYRISSDIAPYLTHPEKPQFRHQVREARAELEALGQVARDQGLRISFHPSQYIVLNSPNPTLVRQNVHDIESQTEILDTMGADAEARIVIHVGGLYGEREAAMARWMRTYEKELSAAARRRLILENDDISFDAADVLAIHRRVGVPLVFDHQHFWCLNRERLPLRPTLEAFLKTWKRGARPKIHFSTPRTEMREVLQRDRATRRRRRVSIPPLLTSHGDFCNPFEFASFMREMEGLSFDVMLESKMKDLALLRLQRDLLRCAPDVAARFGLVA